MDCGGRDAELAVAFADIARSLSLESTVEAVLHQICKVAVDVIPGCESAGTSLVHGPAARQVIRTAVSVGDLGRRVDAVQYAAGEGPCVDAIREHRVFETADLSSEQRWPRFAPRAAEETGVRSMLALRLYSGETTFGALNLYSKRVDAFDDKARALGGVLAAHGAVALSGAKQLQRAESLQQGMASRELVGQAVGILMNRRKLTADAAFDVLVRASQRLNLKLRDVAQDLTETGTDPEDLG